VLELARFSIARQDLRSATVYLQRAVSLSPDDAGIREQLGEVALFAQDYQVAKSAYQAALQLQPRNALDLKLLGDIAVALDRDPGTGSADERSAIAAQPTDQEAGAYLVAILRYLEHDEAGAVRAATASVAPSGGATGSAAFVNLDQLALDRQQTALAAVNHYRSLAGLAAVGIAGLIHQSAQSHAFYTLFNGASPQLQNLGIHLEVSSGLGYTGQNVLTRAEHFGYNAQAMAEVITHEQDPRSAVDDWINSVFHRIPLLRDDLVELGYGDAYLGPLTVQVMDLSYRERTTGRIIVYPASGQTDVPTAFYGNEIPDPDPKASYPVGYPITATFDREATVSITSWRLLDGAGNSLAGVDLLPSNPEMENSFAFLANSPLKPSTHYSMELQCVVNGVPISRNWSFTTASAS
jgi:uncharacterized protein YkwD